MFPPPVTVHSEDERFRQEASKACLKSEGSSLGLIMHEARLERIQEMRQESQGSYCLTNVPRSHPISGHRARCASLGDFSPPPHLILPLSLPRLWPLDLLRLTSPPSLVAREIILKVWVRPQQGHSLALNLRWLPSAKGKNPSCAKAVHDLAQTILPASPATTSLRRVSTLIAGSLDVFRLLGSVSGSSPVTRLPCTLSTCRGPAPTLWGFSSPPNPNSEWTPFASPQHFTPLCVPERVGLYFC